VRLTIERMRTLVLAAGVVLMLALGAFLAIGKWKKPFSAHDLPKRLGVGIQQEANGFTHAEFRAGKAVFKITASRVEQLTNDDIRLHSVRIEMYGAEGRGEDSIEGNEFEYNQHDGIAIAAGPVEITLTRPGDTPALLPGSAEAKALRDVPKTGPLATAVQDVQAGMMRVKTSGLTFDQKSGVAKTDARVEFALAQGSGSAVGAAYDSQKGELVLNRSVDLQTHRGTETVHLTAQHATFDRDAQICRLSDAAVAYRDGEAHSTEATVKFHDDGTAERLDAAKGFALTTVSGGRLAAPTAMLLFGAQNQPAHGHLEGGVTIDADANGRTTHGTAPTAEIEFGAQGVLRRAHLERGVEIASDDQTGGTHSHRVWRSPAANLNFRQAGHGQLELASMHGIGGVVVTSDTERNGTATPARFAADDVTGTFGADSALTAMTGVGHATMEQTTQQGARQITSGDRLEAHFATSARTDVQVRSAAAQVESATVTGHVVLLEQPSAKPGAAAEPPMRATAQRAVYEGAGEWLHLTGAPRVEDGGLQLAADRIDVSEDSGDAFAHGNVKASWSGSTTGKPAGAHAQALGGQGPAHVVSAEAQLHRATGEASFQGQARLWQQANSIAAPTITLDRTRQTLTAHTASAADPVRVVLLSATLAQQGKAPSNATPQVIRVRGGDLKYSEAERKAVMHGAAAGAVVAEASGAVTRSNEVELLLLPSGNRAGRDGGTAQVDRMTARGHVTIDSQGRRGSGEQLVYSGENDTFTLTGTAGAPPRMSDPARGTVTGEALIFNSRDDSVIVEGGGRETTTETTVQKQPR
jgi:lipopolysaccharide export system protein LptA